MAEKTLDNRLDESKQYLKKGDNSYAVPDSKLNEIFSDRDFIMKSARRSLENGYGEVDTSGMFGCFYCNNHETNLGTSFNEMARTGQAVVFRGCIAKKPAGFSP